MPSVRICHRLGSRAVEDPDRLTLPCPLCSKDHHYALAVERSYVLGLVAPGKEPQVKKREFVRFFGCPTTDGMFQATLTLTETALDRIKDVTVGDPEEGAHE